MTISAAYAPDRYSGNDSTTEFAATFPFFSEDELEVVIRIDATGVETVQTKTTHYTVTGGGVALPATGSVTMIAAPATGETLIIRRVTDRLQEVDLTRGGPLPPDSMEGALDRAIMLDQEDGEAAGRSLHYPASDDPALSAELPNAVDRASTYSGFDSNSEPIPLAAPTNTSLTTPFSESLLEQVNEADFLAALFLSIGAEDTVLSSQSGAAVWAENPWPPYHISGFACDGPTATPFVVNIGLGCARAHTTPGTTDNVKNGTLDAATTKKLAGSDWVAGAGADGLANGADAIADDNWYALFLMVKSADGSVDFGFDSSPIATNLKADAVVVAAGFNRFRFICWVQCDDAAPDDIRPFFYNPDSGLWQYREMIHVASGVADATLTLDIPEGELDVLMRCTLESNADETGASFHHVSSSDGSNGSAEDYRNWANIQAAGGTPNSGTGSGVVRADASKQIHHDVAGDAPDNSEQALIGFYVKRSDR
ncbi:MAG: hypothetical protein KAI97_05745 [Gemmatimonadetes bacterium]|nr:hypothetical protein [Gemmatimonadota bacterium]